MRNPNCSIPRQTRWYQKARIEYPCSLPTATDNRQSNPAPEDSTESDLAPDPASDEFVPGLAPDESDSAPDESDPAFDEFEPGSASDDPDPDDIEESDVTELQSEIDQDSTCSEDSLMISNASPYDNGSTSETTSTNQGKYFN